MLCWGGGWMTGFLGYWIIIMVLRLHFWCKCLRVHHCQGAVNSCNPLQKSLNKNRLKCCGYFNHLSPIDDMAPSEKTTLGHCIHQNPPAKKKSKRNDHRLRWRNGLIGVMWRSASVTAPLLGNCDVELSMDSPQVATAISNEGGMYQGDVLRI